MAKLFDRVGQATATTSTGTLTLGAVITDATNGDLATFADMGAVAGDVVNYLIVDGNNWEIGTGTLGGTGPGFTLTRTVAKSKILGTIGTTALTLSGAAKVYSVPTNIVSNSWNSQILSNFASGYSTPIFGSAAGSFGGIQFNSAEIYRWSLHGINNGAGLGASGSGASVGGTLGFGTSVWNNVDVFLQRDGAAGRLKATDSTNSNGTASFSTGGLRVGFAAKTAAYTATAFDAVIACDATSAAFTVTLPTAVGVAGQVHTIKKVDSSANAIAVATTSSQTIDGATTQSLASQWSVLRVISNNANWLII